MISKVYGREIIFRIEPHSFSAYYQFSFGDRIACVSLGSGSRLTHLEEDRTLCIKNYSYFLFDLIVILTTGSLPS